MNISVTGLTGLLMSFTVLIGCPMVVLARPNTLLRPYLPPNYLLAGFPHSPGYPNMTPKLTRPAPSARNNLKLRITLGSAPPSWNGVLSWSMISKINYARLKHAHISVDHSHAHSGMPSNYRQQTPSTHGCIPTFSLLDSSPVPTLLNRPSSLG